MQVQDLIAELQRHDPKAKVRFTMLRGGSEKDELHIDKLPTIPGAGCVEVRMSLPFEVFTEDDIAEAADDLRRAANKLGVKP